MRGQFVESAPARQIVAVVALDAVLVDDGPLLLGGMRPLPPIGPAADRCDDADERDGYEDLRCDGYNPRFEARRQPLEPLLV
jgi:hypothetical protein